MIGYIGIDYRHAGADVRGRVSFTGERLVAALRALRADPAIAEAALLSTCNRTEVYLAGADWDATLAAATRYLRAVFAHGPAAVVPSVPGAPPGHAADPWTGADALALGGLPLETQTGVEAARHLLRVAAGLESMIPGEAQILGQVREALAAAEAEHAVGEELRPLFAAALKAGKHVRTHTALGRPDSSVAATAVRTAAAALGTLAGRSALVIGAGRTSRLCAELLRAAGVQRLLCANRSLAAATQLAEAVEGEALPLAQVHERLAEVDLVVSATTAPHTVLTVATVAAANASAARHAAPLVILDLAVPPDVEEQVALLPHVRLITLDTLRAGSSATAGDAAREAQAITRAEQALEEALHEYLQQRTLRLVVPGIAALRRHVDRSEQAELARALGELAHLPPSEREVIERFGQRLVDKMFHHLVARIRSLAEYDEVPPETTMRVLARLFAEVADPRDPPSKAE